jgi:hypothetical protein
MKPKGTRKSYAARLTPTEKKKICAMTLAGKEQIEIARAFGVRQETIRAAQKAAGLGIYAELTPDLKTKVIALLREGVGFGRVAKMTRLSSTLVREIMDKNHIHHATGDPGMPQVRRTSIIKRVLARKDFGNHIAEKEGVSNDTVLRIAHRLFGEGRFRNRAQPLTFQRNGDGDLEANAEKFAETVIKKISGASVENFQNEMNRIFVDLVEKHLALWHAGQVPADRDLLLYEILETSMPKVLRGRGPLSVEQWDQHRLETANYIKVALDHVAGPESRWTN